MVVWCSVVWCCGVVVWRGVGSSTSGLGLKIVVVESPSGMGWLLAVSAAGPLKASRCAVSAGRGTTTTYVTARVRTAATGTRL